MKVLWIVVSVIFIVVLVKQFGKLSTAIETLSHGTWYFLLAVIAIQAIGIVNRGAFYWSLYEFFSIKEDLRRMTILSLSSNFINLTAPSGGLAGLAIFVSEAEHHGMTKSKSTFINLFGYFLIYALFILVLLFGLFYLLFNHQLQTYQLVSASVVFGMILLLLFIMIISIEEAARLKKLLKFFAAIINFILRILQGKKFLIKHSDVHIASSEINDCLDVVEKNWKGLWLPAFHVILMEIIDLLTLYYLFLAFHYPIYPGILITVYAISVLFSLVSVTPAGVGIVEAAMILVLTNLKVPVELATIVVVGYRLITFWIPFALGYFSFKIYQKEKLLRVKDATG